MYSFFSSLLLLAKSDTDSLPCVDWNKAMSEPVLASFCGADPCLRVVMENCALNFPLCYNVICFLRTVK